MPNVSYVMLCVINSNMAVFVIPCLVWKIASFPAQRVTVLIEIIRANGLLSVLTRAWQFEFVFL